MKHVFKLRYFVLLIIIICGNVSSARSQSLNIFESGRIEFEKKENAYRILDKYFMNSINESTRQYAADYKRTKDQFKITRFSLIFNDGKSLYESIAQAGHQTDFLDASSSSNKVFSSLSSHFFVANKKVLETNFSVKDTIRKIKWKITGETREILGFICHRANAVIMDSIYVVAFYTDQINFKGGPESFSGLPGMILGLALPNEHISWFATKFTPDFSVPILNSMEDYPINNKDFIDKLSGYQSIKYDKRYASFILTRALF
jgi:GLPGLI family protein